MNEYISSERFTLTCLARCITENEMYEEEEEEKNQLENLLKT